MSDTQHPLTDETLDRLVSYISGGTIDCSTHEGRYDSLTEDDARTIVESLWEPMTHAAQDRTAEVTDEMVDAVARAEWTRTHEWPSRSWEKVPADLADYYRECSRHALEAVAPLIAAKAWEEGYAEGRRGRMWESTNPYQTTPTTSSES